MKELETEIGTMKTLGYFVRKNVLDENSMLFEKGIDGNKIENIHVFENGAPRIARFLDTRDYLRSHPDRVKQYEELKERLKQKFPNDYLAYRDAKGDFMEETFALTKEWKAKDE